MFTVDWRTTPEHAARVRENVTAHPARLVRLRSCYQGRHDVLDALWWRVHPGGVSPEGSVDPAAHRGRLQRAVYSAQTDSDAVAGAASSASELLRLEERLRDDARALDAAILRFEGGVLEGGEPAAGDAGRTAARRLDDAPLALEHPLRRRHPIASVLTAAALVVSVAVSVGLWWRIQEVTSANEATTAGAPSESWRTPDVITINALLVFRRSQTLDDVYPLDLAVDYDRTSVRQLTRSDPGDSYRLFATLATSDQVCLVIVFADLSSSSACSSQSDFRDGGLTVVSHAHRVTNAAGSEYVTNEVAWLPDGSLVSRDRSTIENP